MAKRPILTQKQQEENRRRITALRRIWDLGKRVTARLKGTDRSERGAILAAMVDETGDNRGYIDQSRIFFRLYPTKQALEELCRLCRTGYSLTPNHIFVLITVRDDKKREKFIKTSIREGWSAHELRRQVTKQLQYKRYESLERRKPHSLEDAFMQLADAAHQWILWSKRVERAKLQDEVQEALPRDLRKRIASVLEHCEAVELFEQERIKEREVKRLPKVDE